MGVNERRAEIIRILEGRRQEKVANLAAQLGVSKRTIRYDVEALMTEYPIETLRGNGGCVYLPKGYHSYKGDITEEQQNALISAVIAMNKPTAKILGELLRAHGSVRNKAKIEEVLKNV